MTKIPAPEVLVETAQAIKRTMRDREWIKYQRYLAKHAQKYSQQPTEQPISFEKYCAWLEFFEEDMQIPQ